MDDQNIQEGEIVEPEKIQTPLAEENNQATILLSLETVIKSNLSTIERLGIELKKHREMFADSFNNDPVYKEHEEKVKEVSKVKLATKQQILKQPSVSTLAEKIRSISSEIKEKKSSLSDYLLEYQRMSGANEIETSTGDVLDIVNEAKLIKRSSKK